MQKNKRQLKMSQTEQYTETANFFFEAKVNNQSWKKEIWNDLTSGGESLNTNLYKCIDYGSLFNFTDLVG